MKGGGTTGPPVRRLILALGLLSATVIALSGHGLGTRTAAAGAVQRPNIVFVLTDDLDWSLVTAQYMPHVVALERSGETFDHYIVADSLCCPSRSSIFTGLFPHDTGVLRDLCDRPPGSELWITTTARTASWAGSAVGRGLSKVGFRPTPDVAEVARGYVSLADPGRRAAFLATLRSVINVSGQRIDATDRLYLTATCSKVERSEDDAER